MGNATQAPALLKGVTVLDFTHWLAGPTCTRILADLGAEVIKLEPAPDGEAGRRVMEYNGLGAMFAFASAGKKSLCVDIKTEEGAAIAKALAEKVDIVVENFAPGVMKRLGLDYETLAPANPKLIMASCSGFGQFGPLSDKTSFDIIGQAMSGVMDMTGDPNGPPQYVGNYIGDPNTGIHAALGICAALFNRSTTGGGVQIDISQMEALLWLDMVNVPQYVLSKGNEEPSRFGAHHCVVTPLGVFKGRDGYLVLQAMEHQWPNLLRAMGRQDLESDPRYRDNESRLAHLPDVVALIEDWLQTFACNDDALACLREARIPSAPVLSVKEAFNHPHTRARGLVKEVTHPRFGPMEITNTPFFFNGRPTEAQGPAPLAGEHNEDVLARHLGYDEARCATLTDKGVLARETV
ncbi:MAG: CoA transferase [Gammaproteobacteria bacterium]|nr:CoA transferase [Gammaproteobacteria bacterium]